MELKKLFEKREELQKEMKALLDKANTEERALTTEEREKFDSLETQIRDIDATIKANEAARALTEEAPKAEKEEEKLEENREMLTEEEEQRDIADFASYIRGTLEEREDSNITKTDNGAVVPKTIANKIVDKVKDISPLFRDAEKFNVKGTVSIPYVDAATDGITVAYATEFTDLEAKSAKLLSVDLTGFLAGVLAKVSLSLLNSTDIDLVDFVVGKMASAAAVFIDREIIVGTNGKITGLSTIPASQTVTAAATSAVTADELIDLKDKLKSVYQNGAYFVMAPATLTAIRKLKDGNQRYLFNDDITEGFSGTILGKPVYVTDQCPALGAGNKAIFYVNPAQALGVKMVEDSVQILKEKFATQHALGIVNWVEVDAKLQNEQAAAVLKMKAS